MREHGLGAGHHVVVGVGAIGQAGLVGVQEVVDGDLDGALGRLLVAPLVDAELLGLQRPQQLFGDPLDPFDVGPFQVRLLQQVEDRQRLLVQSFAKGAALLLLELLDELEQLLEGPLDGDAVLLAVVLGDDLLVVLLEIGAQRIPGQQALESLLDGVLERLDRRSLFAGALELPL